MEKSQEKPTNYLILHTGSKAEQHFPLVHVANSTTNGN